MAIMTGLSGNEMFCLDKKGYTPGNLVIGNSVFSMGLIGGIGSSFSTLAGGEVEQVTRVIHDGRQNSYERMAHEAQTQGGIGITGVNSELVQHGTNVEFLSVGSCIHAGGARAQKMDFSTCADGQELYCQLDCGFTPKKFVFGNVAYSIGIGGGIAGMFRSMGRGEVKEYSEIFNQTRHLALKRISKEAVSAGANAVVGIETSIIPFRGMQEMVMIGTASHHDALPSAYSQSPVTSDLTNEEMWNLAHLGYMPLQLVLGCSVYSLGIVGGILSAFKALARGEIKDLTNMIYEARENAISRIARDATACGADDVVGIKTNVYDLGSGTIEFLAIGTAVKKMPNVRTLTDSLPPQAIIRDRDTFVNTAETSMGSNLNKKTQE